MGQRKFDSFVEDKIVPIHGDLNKEGLGLSNEDKSKLAQNLNIIFNSAADTNMNNPLKKALNINYFGTVRLLDLAKKCKKFEVFSHVSTVGVNTNKKGGYIEEIIYHQQGEDIDGFTSKVMSMSDEEVKVKQKELLGNFPNSYTFSKNMAEKYLQKHNKYVKVLIHRPADISPSYAEPFPAWTDTL